MDRARLATDTFVLNDQNAPTVAEICRRLDGIPLAIELAAARVKLLSVDQIKAKLDDRFRLFVGGKANAVSRHQTLLATIQWSYDQLSPEEQQQFRALAVFSGGWTLETATKLRPDLDEMQVLEQLERLIDKSLVIVDRDRNDIPRYGFLETVRQYAEERLIEANESDAIHDRHGRQHYHPSRTAHLGRIGLVHLWRTLQFVRPIWHCLPLRGYSLTIRR